jgi:hypothetical protein
MFLALNDSFDLEQIPLGVGLSGGATSEIWWNRDHGS